MTEKPRLFHVSEEEGIARFEPRSRPDDPGRRAVWAIDRQRVQNYLLPRDCPRVTLYCGTETTQEDRRRFFNGDTTSHVVAIEAAWFERSCTTQLYLYEFPVASFYLEDQEAGYWLSHAAVKPISIQLVDRPIEALLAMGTELRVLPSLWAFREAVIRSSVQYSIIRMRNAARPTESPGVYTPVPKKPHE